MLSRWGYVSLPVNKTVYMQLTLAYPVIPFFTQLK